MAYGYDNHHPYSVLQRYTALNATDKVLIKRSTGVSATLYTWAKPNYRFESTYLPTEACG